MDSDFTSSDEDYSSDISDMDCADEPDEPFVLTFTCVVLPHKAILSTGQPVILPTQKRIITIFIRSITDAVDRGILHFSRTDCLELRRLPKYMDIESSKCVFMHKCVASHILLESFDTMQIPLTSLPELLILKDIQQP